MSYLKVRSRPTTRINVPNFLSGVNTAYDESVLSTKVASNCYNFDFRSGALKGCTGFTDTGIEADSVWTFESAAGKYLMYCKNGEVFYKSDKAEGKLEGISLSGIPKAISYRLYGEDVILICSPSDGMVVWNGVDAAYFVGVSPLITSMAIHYERMFVTTSNSPDTLWFSDDLDPTNWNTDMSEGGFIELADERGKLIRALEFLNYVYIFREYGISRLTAYADQSEFSISHLFVTSGEIYPESIAMCGDKVIFASSDGIFAFDGVSARRILQNLDGLIIPDNSSAACYHDGKYFLATKAAFDGSVPEYNNAVLIYGDDGYTLLRGYKVDRMHSADELYAIIGGTIHRYDGKCLLSKRWAVPETDLGSGRMKRIKVLYIDTRTDINVTVTIDGTARRFFVAGRGTVSRININMTGRKFGMVIDCDAADPLISRPQLSVSFVDS